MFTEVRTGLRGVLAGLALLAATGAAGSAAASEAEPLAAQQDVRATEQAFAQTMADRDFERFKTFLSAETVFFSGDRALRGAGAVADAWKAYFDGPEPPFSWRPDIVEVLDSGTLALSSGPVFGSDGQRVGTFSSIWRREASGAWKIVFDKGEQVCPTRP